MNDFIDLPHLPECLLGLPLETIHEIHSHTYHAIKADRQKRGDIDYKQMFDQMCERCDYLDAKLAEYSERPVTPTQETSDGQIMEAVESYGDACRQSNITVSEQEMRLHGIRALLARYGAAPKSGEEE